MSHRLAIRIGLGYLAFQSAYVAVWILLAPRGFYDTFPTGPAEWVSPLPPFNEHLLRDFGAAGLGLAVLAVLAAVWLERRLRPGHGDRVHRRRPAPLRLPRDHHRPPVDGGQPPEPDGPVPARAGGRPGAVAQPERASRWRIISATSCFE